MQTHSGATYSTRLGLQAVEAHAVLQQADQRVRLDGGRKGQRVGVADPASRELQRGITEARLLQVAPDCSVLAERSSEAGAACRDS